MSEKAPGRYCLAVCYEPEPREGQAHVIYLPTPRTTSPAWANREESTWIDKL